MTPWPKWYRPPVAKRIADIVHAAAQLSGYTVDQIKGQQRQSQLCEVRAAICHVARSRGHSFPKIGRNLGGRDHTTIIHAANKADALLTRDPDFVAFLHRLQLECASPKAVWA